MRIILATVIGFVVGAISSLLIVELGGPVFAWEMAGMVMIVICTLFAGVCGGLTSALVGSTRWPTLSRSVAGLFVGSALGLVVGFFVLQSSSATHPDAPAGLAFWVVVMVVIAGALSGLIGGLVATKNNATS